MNSLDILVALKLLSLNLQQKALMHDPLTAQSLNSSYGDEALAASLGIDCADIANSLRGLEHSRLILSRRNDRIQVNVQAMDGIVKHALRFFFPVVPGRDCIVTGMPTAHCAAPMSKRLFGATTKVPVWPCLDGGVLGYEITPLHQKAPEAASKDPVLYSLLALVDSFRLGAARERAVATELFDKILK